MRFKEKERKLLYFAIIMLVALSVAQPIFEFKGKIFVHEDTPFIGLNDSLNNYINSIYDSFFLYDSLDYSGNIQQGMYSPLNYIFEFLFLPFVITNGIIYNVLANILFLLIGSLAMFAFIFKLFEKNTHLVRIMASFIGALIFFPAIGAESAFLPICFLFILVVYEKFNNKAFSFKKNYYGVFGSILSISFLFALGGSADYIQDFILIFLLIIFLSLLTSEKKLKLFFILFSILVIALLVNLSGIVGAYLLSLSNSANTGYYSFMNAPLRYAFGNSNVLYALQILTYPLTPLLILLKLLLFVFVITGLIYAVKRRIFRSNAFAIIFSSFVIFIIITFFYNTIFMPFGGVFKILISHFKFLYAVRYGGSFYYLIEFIIGILSATAIVSYGVYLKDRQRSLILVFLILALIGFVFFYYGDVVPYIGVSYYYVKIPSHVYSISNYIDNISGDFGVAVLPSAAGFQYLENWYTGTDIYSYFVNKPVYTGGYIAQTEIFYPTTKYFYQEITSPIDNGDVINNYYISSLFGIIGIKYILVQGDAIVSSPYDPGYSDSFSFNDIYANLNRSKNIILIKRYGNTSLYENLNYVQSVYASNVRNIGNISESELPTIISNRSFDIMNDSLFITSISGFYNDTNTINATPISNFSKPSIRFTEDTPTKVTVHVSNATTPYYLVFRETYDPHWAAYYSNGTMIPERDHILVNGFANAWYIDRPGNYTITLYYTLQTEAWIAWAISFAALFLTVGIGVYGWRTNRARNRESRRR